MRRRILWLFAVFFSALATADFAVGGRRFRVLQSTRHDNYELRFQVKDRPFDGSFAIVVGYSGDAPFALLEWRNDGTVQLSRCQGGATVCLAEAEAEASSSPLPAVPFELVFRHRDGLLEVVAGGRRVLRTMADGIGRGEVAVAGVTAVITSYQRLEHFDFGDDFMRTEEEARQWGLWKPLTGKWVIHSVMERIQANPDARIREGREPVPDRSPNPFSLAGSAESGEALIMTGEPFWCDYEAAVSVRPAPGGDFGIAVSMRDPSNCFLLRWRLPSLGMKPSIISIVARRNGSESVLASTCLEGRAENWQRLALRTRGDSLLAILDGVPILSASAPDSTGGPIALLCSGSMETRFDDVIVRSLHAIPFGQLPAHDDDVLIGRWERNGDNARVISDGKHGRNSLLAFGLQTWRKTSLSAIVQHNKKPFSLIFALQDKDNFYEASWAPSLQGTAAITRWVDGKPRVLATLRHKLTGSSSEVGVYYGDDGSVEFRVDGVLVLRVGLPTGSGASVSGGRCGLSGVRGVSFGGISVNRALEEDWERPVDIARFANDPFMQGWASTRYCWLRQFAKDTYPQRYVFTGDIYGAMQLDAPLIPGLAFTFGLDVIDPAAGYLLQCTLDETDGAGSVTLSRAGKPLVKGDFTGKKRKLIPGVTIIDEKIGERPRTPDTPSWGALSIRRDGHIITASLDGTELFSVAEEAPLRGRMLAMDVPCAIDFINVSLRRGNLLDYLFEQAETDWGGIGRWEVINRFACDPRWSHENGESRGTASIWSKFSLPGDYTIECFAGMRMRQGELLEGAKISYPRVGDINVALNADGRELFSGYNLLIAAWDREWSEKWTRFMRLDKSVRQSDRELIPRGRHLSPGSRAVEIDWDPGGRPVHGAWYALKIRKTGSLYDIWFDNIPVFSFKDEEPLRANGKIALWTQHNSIVIARMKIGYQALNRQAPKTQMPPTQPQEASVAPTLLLDGLPAYYADFEGGLRGLAPWNGDQSAELNIVPRKSGGHALRAENVNSGGDFGIRIPLAGSNLRRAVCIDFDCRIPAGTKVNLYFMVREHPHGLYFVTLTGPSGPQGNSISVGSFGNAATELADDKWHHVSFALADVLAELFPWEESWTCDGMLIGMLHEGYLNSGMDGNHEGATFFIDNLSVTAAAPHDITAKWRTQEGTSTPAAAVWLDSSASSRRPAESAVASESSVSLHAAKPGPAFVVAEDGSGAKLAALPVIVQSTAKAPLPSPADGAKWPLSSITVTFDSNSRDYPLPSKCILHLGDKRLTASRLNTTLDMKARKITFVPDIAELATVIPDTPLTASFEWTGCLSGNQRSITWNLIPVSEADRTPPTAPIIESVLATLDARPAGQTQCTRAGKESEDALIVSRLPNGNAAATITAAVAGSDIAIAFPFLQFSPAQNPRLFFDYNIPPNTFVDLRMIIQGREYTIGLSDCEPKVGLYLGAVDGIIADGKWHSADIDILEHIYKVNVNRTRLTLMASLLAIGNFNYKGTPPGASWSVSNVRLARLVSSADAPLRLAWASTDAGGIAGYSYILDNQPLTVPPETINASSNFCEVKRMPDGVAFFHVRACDKNGNWGPTTHQPYIFSNVRPAIASVSPADKSLAAPLEIKVAFTKESGSIDFSAFNFRINGTKRQLSNATAAWDAVNNILTWHLGQDYLLRKHLADRAEFAVSLSGIKNAAGLSMPDYEWSWNLDFSQDKTPPPPPNVSDYHALFRFCETFSGKHWWRGTRANVQVVCDEEIGSQCLEIKYGAEHRPFASSWRQRVTTEKFPFIRFRYNIRPGSTVDLLLHRAKKWESILLCGTPSAEAPDVKLDGIVADGKWHWFMADLRPVLRKLFGADNASMDFNTIGLGCMSRIPTASTIRIDDFGFVGYSGPVPMFTFYQNDATGISRCDAKLSMTAEDFPQAPQAPGKRPLKALDKEGLWFLHAYAIDGAGNKSETTHIPFICNAAAPLRQPDALEAQNGWIVTPLAKFQKTQAYLLPAKTDDENSLLAIQFYRTQKGGTAVMKRLPKPRSANKITLDYFVQGTADFTFQAVAFTAPGNAIGKLLKNGATPLIGEPVKSGKTNEWQNLKLNLPKLPKLPKMEQPATWIGILITPPAKCRDSIIFDNIKLK